MRNPGVEEAQAGINIARRNINLSLCRWHHPYSRKGKRTKEVLDEVKEDSEKVGLKLNIQKTKIMASGPTTGETMETVTDFGAPKSLQMVIAAMKLKDIWSLEEKLWPT